MPISYGRRDPRRKGAGAFEGKNVFGILLLAGALIVIRPGSGLFGWAVLFPLAGALSYASFQVLTAKLSALESPYTTHFYTGLTGTLVLTQTAEWTTSHALTLGALLIDRVQLAEQPFSAFWYTPVRPGNRARVGTVRLTSIIDRQDSARTVAGLFAPSQKATADVPPDAWIRVG